MGRINRLLMAARAVPQPPRAEPLCPLCGRAIPAPDDFMERTRKHHSRR